MPQNAESLYVWGLTIGILLYIVLNDGTVSEQQTRRDGTESAYRVNIKSFPDYKHLLQENYCMFVIRERLQAHPV